MLPDPTRGWCSGGMRVLTPFRLVEMAAFWRDFLSSWEDVATEVEEYRELDGERVLVRAYGMTYRSHRHRHEALPHWLEHYNARRPHSGIGNRPPVSRVHNLCGQDT
jgi:transposase InsO family protein